MHDYLIVIACVQPFHDGHYQAVSYALAHANHVVLLCGSANGPRTSKTPFTFKECETMVRSCFLEDDNEKLIIKPLEDTLYNEPQWCLDVKNIIASIINFNDAKKQEKKLKIGLVGEPCHEKEHERLFPQWSFVKIDIISNVNSDDIRRCYFNNENQSIKELKVPQKVRDFLKKFSHSQYFKSLCDEYAYLVEYKKKWQAAPFPPIFVTVDALVLQKSHVLLVERKGCPGKGLHALPGGFVNQDEFLFDACIRELFEETSLDMKKAQLKSHLMAQSVFDAPCRSQRGRTITHVFHFQLNDDSLINVVGGDDAMRAFWHPLSTMKRADMFEDHFHIIQKLTGD
jgi:bifunctional NMN adenylyltransferase/nudix hydrolase